MFCSGKLHLESHTLTVLSYDPETKIWGDLPNLTLLTHLAWDLKVLVGLEVYLLSQSLIWPSSWADNICEPLTSTETTTESRVRMVSALASLVTLVSAISCALEPETTSSLFIQLRHSIVPLWIVYDANKGSMFRLSSAFFFFLVKALCVPDF